MRRDESRRDTLKRAPQLREARCIIETSASPSAMHRDPRTARVLICLVLPSALFAAEIATGSMLGVRYDQRALYFRTPDNQTWRKTYSSKGYRHEARGKLMNLRLAQALFHDEWLTE